MHKYFIVLSIIFLALSCGKETENFKPTTNLENILKDKKLNKIYYEFRLNNVYLTNRIDTIKSFQKFVAETGVKELVSLTECEQPIVRCFAFKALVEKKYPEIRNILLRHKNDEKIVKEYGRCVEFNRPVKDYMLIQLEPFSESEYRFSKTEYQKIKKDFWAE